MILDNYLITRIKNNDTDAFELLYKKYYRLVYNYARYFISNVEACHDVVQDIFTYVWEKRSKIDVEQSIKSYLLSATHNACINLIKRESNYNRLLATFFNNTPNEIDGYEKILENSLKQKIQDIINRLPEQCREIFILSREKGMKHKEIAEKLNISPRTVETQIYRALKVLKNNLGI